MTVKERPILMSPPMIRAYRAGLKSQTRRIVKFDVLLGRQPEVSPHQSNDGSFLVEHWEKQDRSFDDFGRCDIIRCPYGQPGDRLYFKEAWRTGANIDKWNAAEIEMHADEAGYYCGPGHPPCPLYYASDGYHRQWAGDDVDMFGQPGRYRHARFMPRWAARFTPLILSVRVERVQEISREDAIAEGISVLPLQSAEDTSAWWQSGPGENQERTPQASYRALYNSINGPDAWDRNDWVWVVEFERHAV